MMYIILTFFLGAAVGSFINVLIDRTVHGEDWVRGRSHCDYCKKKLAWYDMIPIMSYLLYRGKSRCCRVKLSYRYPIVETMVGLLFGWWLMVGFWFFQLASAPLVVIQPAFWLLTGITIIILILTDLFYGVVLLPIVWLGVSMTLIYRLVLWHFEAYRTVDLMTSLIVALIAFGLFWSLYKLTKGRGMADGDMYVAAYVGLLTGWPRGALALGLSFVLGAIVGVSLMVFRLRSRNDTLPFVPFMMVAMLIVLVWGERLIGFLG
ncbi:MAG: prepilin peptidase [bacterium]